MSAIDLILINFDKQLKRKGYVKMEMIEYIKHYNNPKVKEYIETKELNYCEGLNHNFIFLFPDPEIDYERELAKDPRLDCEDILAEAVWKFLDQIIRKEFVWGIL